MSRSLTQLRLDVRRRADMENDLFVSVDACDTFINQALAEVHRLVANTYEDYFLKRTTATVAAGSNTISIPSDCARLRGVKVQSGSVWTPLDRVSVRESDRYDTAIVVRGGRVPRAYYLTESTIFILPEAQADGSYRILYDRSYTALSSGSDTTTLDRDAWYDLAVALAAIKMKDKEDSDTSVLEREAARLRADIIASATNRDAGEPATIIRVMNYLDDDDAEWVP